MVNLFVIDDHPFFIDGLKSTFNPEVDKIKISGWAHSAKEAMPKLKRSEANVVILDLAMPGLSGVEFCAVIKKKFPDKKVIVLTGSLNTVQLFNTWRNKADAILLKYCGKEELVDTIKDVLAGRRIVGENVPEFDDLYDEPKNDNPKFTKTEERILKLLVEGHTRKEISILLGNSASTISFHCRNLFKKVNKTKLVSVIEEAKKLNLID